MPVQFNCLNILTGPLECLLGLFKVIKVILYAFLCQSRGLNVILGTSQIFCGWRCLSEGDGGCRFNSIF